MILKISSDTFLFMNGHSVSDTLDDIDQKRKAKGVQGQLLCSYVFGVDFLQLNCTSQNDKLMAAGVICSQKLKYFLSGFDLNERVELCQMHVVLNNLEQQQKSRRDFIDSVVDYNLVSNDSKVVYELLLDQHTRLTTQSIDEDA